MLLKDNKSDQIYKMCDCYEKGYKCDCRLCNMCRKFQYYGRDEKTYSGLAKLCDYSYTYEGCPVTSKRLLCGTCRYKIKGFTGIDLDTVTTSD